jgi:5'-3' exonuclease
MGIKELWSKALGDIKKKDAVPFSTLRGTIVGVDVSIWLHMYCHTDTVALHLNSVPKYAPTELLAKFQSNHRALVNEGITPYYCFDGFRHPMKKVAREERENKYNSAKQWLDCFYDDARNDRPIDDARRESAMKFLRDITIPDPLVVSYIIEWMGRENIPFECAPFEAEWQLIKMESENIVGAVMTTDGDAIILGAKIVLYEVDFKKKSWKVYRQNDIIAGNSPLSEYDPTSWPAIACMLGSDYHARIPDVGYKRVFNILPHLRDFHAETIAATMKSKYPSQWEKLPEDYDYVKNLTKSIALFRHSPVLDIDGNLIPLNTLPEGVTWGNCIGLGDSSPAELLPPAVESFQLARRFQGPTFITGSELPRFEVPCYTDTDNPDVEPDIPLPPFSRLDFNKVPASCLHSGVLQSYVSARLGYGIPVVREELEATVRKLASLKNPILEPEKVPMQIGRWLVYEILEPIPSSNWAHDCYFEAVCQRVNPITNDIVKRFYPKGNEHNRVRAELLVKGGNVDYSSINFRECRSRADPHKVVLLFRCLVVPSMKTEVLSANEGEEATKQSGYTVYLAFDSSGCLLQYPFSCCGCYDGRGCCSHQLAKLVLFGLIQNSPSQAVFEEVMPDPPHDIQNVPTMVEFACLAEIEKRRKARKKEERALVPSA